MPAAVSPVPSCMAPLLQKYNTCIGTLLRLVEENSLGVRQMVIAMVPERSVRIQRASVPANLDG